jgi:hypothetical protein
MKAARVVALALFALLPAVPCQACGFIVEFASKTTLREEADNSKLIVYGTLRNPQANPDGSGTTELVVAGVIKSHPILGDQKVLELPRYIPVENPKEPPQYLIFCDVYKGTLDPYRGIRTGPAMVGYLNGLLALDGKDRVALMRYCFGYLEHSDPEIASDAYLQFMKSPDADIGKVAGGGEGEAGLEAEKLRGWLRDPKTPPERLRLYGFLLGNCGKPEDADLLRRLAEKNPTNADGILTGYTLLKPKEGWAHVRGLLEDKSQSFAVRYQALRTARFFHNTRPEVIAKKDVVEALSLLLDQADIADLPITDLCRWRCWDLTDRILAVAKRPSHNLPIVRRAVLRYALQCPGAPAAAFVAERRKTNPELVADVEELLRLEEPTPPSSPPAGR